MIVNALGVKKKPEELFPTLRDMRQAEAKYGTKPVTSVAQQFMMKFGHLFPELKLEK